MVTMEEIVKAFLGAPEDLRKRALETLRGDAVARIERLYSLKEAADILGVSYQCVFRAVHEGRMAFIELGSSKKRIPESELARLTQSKKMMHRRRNLQYFRAPMSVGALGRAQTQS